MQQQQYEDQPLCFFLLVVTEIEFTLGTKSYLFVVFIHHKV